MKKLLRLKFFEVLCGVQRKKIVHFANSVRQRLVLFRGNPSFLRMKKKVTVHVMISSWLA
jgi:hypothetical protein